MDRTLEILTSDGTAPAVTPSGGTLETDFTAQILLLGNRLTAIENSLATLTKALEKPAPADEPPEETPEESPAADSPEESDQTDTETDTDKEEEE